MNIIKRIFSFGRSYDEFELLETEGGQPGFFGSAGRAHKDAAGAIENANDTINCDVSANEERLKTEMHAEINPDMVMRRFLLCGQIEALAVFINGMSDQSLVSDFILRQGIPERELPNDAPLVEYVANNVFAMAEVKQETSWNIIKTAIMDGCTAVFIQGQTTALTMDTRSYEHRSIQEPSNEKVVKGSQEGFVENLRTNITLIRRRVRTDDLVVELRTYGKEGSSRAAIMYREGIANESLVNEIKRRLANVNAMYVFNAGTLEQLTERNTYSVFPQLLATERPDRTAAMLMEGHVAVIVEGSPTANVMPATLFTLMATGEDSTMRVVQGSVIRLVRYIGAAISILLPGYFLALALHHQSLLSSEVLTTVVASRKMVFAPIGMEMLFLLLVFQLVRSRDARTGVYRTGDRHNWRAYTGAGRCNGEPCKLCHAYNCCADGAWQFLYSGLFNPTFRIGAAGDIGDSIVAGGAYGAVLRGICDSCMDGVPQIIWRAVPCAAFTKGQFEAANDTARADR